MRICFSHMLVVIVINRARLLLCIFLFFSFMRSQFQAELYLIMYQTVLYQYFMSLIFYKKSVLCISINFLVVDVIYMFTQCRMTVLSVALKVAVLKIVTTKQRHVILCLRGHGCCLKNLWLLVWY